MRKLGRFTYTVKCALVETRLGVVKVKANNAKDAMSQVNLMGLDQMPWHDPHKREKRVIEIKHNNSVPFSEERDKLKGKLKLVREPSQKQ